MRAFVRSDTEGQAIFGQASGSHQTSLQVALICNQCCSSLIQQASVLLLQILKKGAGIYFGVKPICILSQTA